MRIVDLSTEDDCVVEQVATLLLEGVAVHSSNPWSDVTSALDEVGESFDANHISRVAFDDGDTMLGWTAGYSTYNGYIWQLYPLVLATHSFNLDIGHLLIQDFEEQVRTRGGLSILLSIDVEPALIAPSILCENNLWQHMTALQRLDNHRIEFFRQLGFTIVGVIPNAHGQGKPDVLLERSVTR